MLTPATFSGRKGLTPLLKGLACPSGHLGIPSGSRQGPVPRDPPFIPNHATRSKSSSCTHSLSMASNKLFSSGGVGRAQTFSGIKGFVGLDCGKVPTHTLHKKQLFEFWQRWEEVCVMPVFAIRLFTKKQPTQTYRSTEGKATQARLDFPPLGTGRVFHSHRTRPRTLPPPVLARAQAMGILLDQREDFPGPATKRVKAPGPRPLDTDTTKR